MNDILDDYVEYRESIKIIGSYPLEDKLPINGIGLSRGNIQAAYKKIESLNFRKKLNVIDYICWVATRWFFSRIVDLEMTMIIIHEGNQLKAGWNFKQIFYAVSKIYENAAKCMIRLWRDNPKLVEKMFNEIATYKRYPDTDEEPIDFFYFMSDLYKKLLSKQSNS